MSADVPQSLRVAAAAQIASGVVSLAFMWWISSCTVTTFCTIATLGFGGQICGLFPWLLIPLGLVEIGVGVFGMLNPREAAPWQRLVGFAEVGSLLLGGVSNAVCGLLATWLLGRDESVAFLEG